MGTYSPTGTTTRFLRKIPRSPLCVSREAVAPGSHYTYCAPLHTLLAPIVPLGTLVSLQIRLGFHSCQWRVTVGSRPCPTRFDLVGANARFFTTAPNRASASSHELLSNLHACEWSVYLRLTTIPLRGRRLRNSNNPFRRADQRSLVFTPKMREEEGQHKSARVH